MFQKETLKQPAYLLAGVLFTLIALVALTALLVLKSKADTAEQQVNIETTAPTVDSLTVSDTSGAGDIGPADSGSGFTTNEGLTRTLYVRGSVSDQNGCPDLANVVITVYRSGATGAAACTPDLNDCYRATILPAAFEGCSGGGTPTTVTFETSFAVANFVDPTDAGSPYDGQTWIADAVVTDDAALTATSWTDFKVNSLAAFSVPGAINYGAVGLGLDSDAIGLTFSNTGNRLVDAEVVASTQNPLVGDMTSNLSGFANIPASAVHYSMTSGFTYGTGDTAVSKLASTDLALGLAQQTDDLTVPTADTYWRLRMPATGVNGTYTNTLIFTAKAGASTASLGVLNSESIANVKASTVENNTAYVVSSNVGSGTLTTYDVSNSTEATVIGSSIAINNATDIYKNGDYVVVTSESATNNFEVFNVADPAQPLIQAAITAMTGGIKDAAYIDSNYVATVGTDAGGNFEIVNITNKANPSVVAGSSLTVTSTLDTAVTVVSVEVVGNTAYVYSTNENSGTLTAIDITTKDAPVVISAIDVFRNGVLTINSDGNTAYVIGLSEMGNTIESVDITNDSAMTVVASQTIDNNTVTDAVYVNDIVYVATLGDQQPEANVSAVNVSNSASMYVIDSTLVGAAGQTVTLTANASYVYVTAQTDATYNTLNAAQGEVAAAPTITTLSSASFIGAFLPGAYVVPFNAPIDLIINGTGFVDGQMTVRWNGGSLPAGSGAVTVLSPTQIEVLGIPAEAFTPGGATIQVQVRNTALEQTSTAVQISVIAS